MGDKRTVLNHAGLHAQEMFEYLSQFTDEERKEMQLFIRTAPPDSGRVNIRTIDFAEETTYGFFGMGLPCIVCCTEDYAPPDPDDEDDEEGDEDDEQEDKE